MFGFSIFTTSAPSHANASVQDGPASNWVKSTILMPERNLNSVVTPSGAMACVGLSFMDLAPHPGATLVVRQPAISGRSGPAGFENGRDPAAMLIELDAYPRVSHAHATRFGGLTAEVVLL